MIFVCGLKYESFSKIWIFKNKLSFPHKLQCNLRLRIQFPYVHISFYRLFFYCISWSTLLSLYECQNFLTMILLYSPFLVPCYIFSYSAFSFIHKFFPGLCQSLSSSWAFHFNAIFYISNISKFYNHPLLSYFVFRVCWHCHCL